MPDSSHLKLESDLLILVVDDEIPARSELIGMLRSLKVKSRIMEAASVVEALDAIKSASPDFILLDIQMPGGDGFGVLERLGAKCPPVIFTTAYDHFAARAFEMEAVDYLLKPFDKSRLLKALGRLPRNQKKPSKLTLGDRVLLKIDGECLLVPVESIHLLESRGSTTSVFWGNHHGAINKTLKYLEQKFDDSLFFRTSRDQVINLRNVLSLGNNEEGMIEAILPGKHRVTFSRRQGILFRQSHKP
jgi:two-component system, LytTR family, response regulator